MIARVCALVVAVAVLAGIGLTAGRAHAQVSGERVIVTPGEGNPTSRFLFTGSGYIPGRYVTVRVLMPDGTERRLTTEDNAELVWLVCTDSFLAGWWMGIRARLCGRARKTSSSGQKKAATAEGDRL